MPRLANLLERRSAEALVGRDDELERLASFVAGDEPLVMYVHGIAGVGKSTLLDALAQRLASASTAWVRLDARTCEPSPASFCEALGDPPPDGTSSSPSTSPSTSGSSSASSSASASPSTSTSTEPHPAAVAARLSARAERVVLVIDGHESFRLLDGWLRQIFLPLLGDHVRTILVSREPPPAAWSTAPAWRGLFGTLRVEPFPEAVALDYLTARGVSLEAARELNALAAGHPLALALSLAAPPSARATTATRHQVLDHLATLFLEDAADPVTRRIAQAACVVRTVTVPLLAAMVPDVPDAIDRLRALPFVTAGAGGLEIHDAVRAAVAAALRADDPARYQEHRRAAAAIARDQYRRATRSELWRCTADVLYLLENEALRGGFFPPEPAVVAVEPARPEDLGAIRALAVRHDGPEALAALELWWRYHPESFFVVRDDGDTVVGYYHQSVASKVHRNVIERDPLVARWARDMPRAEDRAMTLWLRRALARDSGEGRSPVQAACWIDIKRSYLELRPRLRWVKTWMHDAATYGASLEQLGFREDTDRASTQLRVDARPVHAFTLDMGPDSVDGWLGRVLSAEVGVPSDDEPVLLDDAARELIVTGERMGLTPLEFGVLSYLSTRPGRAVARHELIEAVWGHGKDAATSNVVEAVVRSLRAKLGDQRDSLETVRGVGYRYRRPGDVSGRR